MDIIKKMKFECAKIEGEYKDVAAKIIELNQKLDECVLHYSDPTTEEGYEYYVPINVVAEQIEVLGNYKALLYDRLGDLHRRIHDYYNKED